MSTSDQQAGDTPDRQDRYPSDQQFGASAAVDQELVDELGEEAADAESIRAHQENPPRAGTKAEPA